MIFNWRKLPTNVAITYLIGYIFFFSVISAGYTSSYNFVGLIVGTVILITGVLYNRKRVGKHIAKSTVLLILSAIFTLYLLQTDTLTILNRFSHQMSTIATLDLSEISPTISVRIIEMINILHNGVSNPVNLVFGNGIGSSFTDSYLSFDRYVTLGDGDYSDREIAAGRYYTPHNTPNYVLLKFGLFGLFALGYIMIRAYKILLNSSDIIKAPALSLMLMTGWVVGWQFKISILIGISLGLLELSQKPRSRHPE
jgi:O-antigen ligase